MKKRFISFHYHKSAGAKRYPARTLIKFSAVFFMFALISAFLPAASAAGMPDISAKAAVVIEANSATVLYEKNADQRMLIASTTKILTALIVLESGDVDEKVVIPNDFPQIEGSSIYLKAGQELTVRELLYGMMLDSGNDAAVALALHVSGSVEYFSNLMNQRAKELGCKNSHFVNPHGLDDEGQYSSARDLALIASAAMKNKTFCEIVSTKSINIGGRFFRNHNKLLWNCQGALGIKTGFTESAGRSLVSCIERDGMRLICVTLSDPNDWQDHTALYDWAYEEFRCLNISRQDARYGNIPVISGIKQYVAVRPGEDFTLVYSKDDKIELCCELSKFAYAPVNEKDKAGVIRIKQNSKTIKEIPIIYSESVMLDASVKLNYLEMLKWRLFQDK